MRAPCRNASEEQPARNVTSLASRWPAALSARSPVLSLRLLPYWARRFGMHTVCVEATEEFLAFSKARGNDLSTPRPEFGFPGLEPGDRWCLCAARWREAFEAGRAPRVILASTHEATLEIVDLGDLKRYAIDFA